MPACPTCRDWYYDPARHRCKPAWRVVLADNLHDPGLPTNREFDESGETVHALDARTAAARYVETLDNADATPELAQEGARVRVHVHPADSRHFEVFDVRCDMAPTYYASAPVQELAS